MKFTIDDKRIIKWMSEKICKKRLLKMILTKGEVLMG